MGRKISISLQFFHLASLLLCSRSIMRVAEAMGHTKLTYRKEENLKHSISMSIKQMDITTPIITVPTTNPIMNPSNSIPNVPTVMNPANPVMTPLATALARSWCIAAQSVSQNALQVALDYACGHGADCSAIQPSGGCYNPNTVRDHVSYAFNSYYQKNPIPTSCNFGGTAVTTNTDPSSVTCQYPSISTTSSVLNTTNSNGSRVFGAGRPNTPSISTAAIPSSILYFQCILVFLAIILVVSKT